MVLGYWVFPLRKECSPMVSFKGGIRGAVCLFIGGWMFFLGILVGRGTSPVTFDTKPFHERLETILQKRGTTDGPAENMDLQFYDALNRPVRQEVSGKKNNPNEIIPKKEAGFLLTQPPVAQVLPVKTSMKTATLNKRDPSTPRSIEKGAKAPETSKITKDKTPEPKVRIEQEIVVKAKESPVQKDVSKEMYTIQIAAYNAFTDAVTHMALLEKKGFASYRVVGKKEGVTWYRVRVGSFATWDMASRYLEKLKEAEIDGMILKKE